MTNIYRLDDYIDKQLTYKQLTDILEIQYYKGGNSKKKQLEEIQLYYELEKVGTKYLIIDSIPEQLMGRGGSSSTYYNDLEIIILYALYKHRNRVTILSTNKALQMYAFTNINYIIGYRDTRKTSNILKIDNTYLDEFYSSTKKRFKRILDNALNKMQDKRLIDYTKIKMIVYYDMIEDTYTYIEATELLISKIVDIEKRVMNQMGFEDLKKLKHCGKYKLFLSKCNVVARDELEIAFYYEAYRIVKGEEAIAGEIKKIEANICKDGLNSKILESVYSCKDKLINSNLEHKKKCIEILIDRTQDFNLLNEIERIDKEC